LTDRRHRQLICGSTIISVVPPLFRRFVFVGEAMLTSFEIFADICQRIETRLDRRGQGLAEYALILALIAIVAVVALLFLGGVIKTTLSTVGTKL
jgi:Flp pilus assembly pilin Flp